MSPKPAPVGRDRRARRCGHPPCTNHSNFIDFTIPNLLISRLFSLFHVNQIIFSPRNEISPPSFPWLPFVKTFHPKPSFQARLSDASTLFSLIFWVCPSRHKHTSLQKNTLDPESRSASVFILPNQKSADKRAITQLTLTPKSRPSSSFRASCKNFPPFGPKTGAQITLLCGCVIGAWKWVVLPITIVQRA
jgi:hypothetical protein